MARWHVVCLGERVIFRDNKSFGGGAMPKFSWSLAVLCSAGACAADGEDKQLSLTIYNKNLALVEHIRPVSLTAGLQRLEFAGVSAQILPETVSFLGSNLELVEQNFDYDLLTPAKLMEKAVGGTVRLVRTNPATGAETSETAEVLSTTGGTVMRIGSRIEVLREDNLPTRVVFDKVPENLRARPTLSVLINSDQASQQDVRLTYLTRGIAWDADYVAVFDEPKGMLSMQGWITLQNRSGTTFANARARLVAGDLNVSDSEDTWRQVRQASAQRSAGRESSARPQLADYYVYPIAQATTLANNQTKQVSFLEAPAVRASKGYEVSFNSFDSGDEPVSAQVRIRFSNSGTAGLGEPLPAGVTRVYARDSRGAPQFVGEDLLGHTSAGSDIALRIGDAFDVTVLPTVNQTTRVNKRTTEYQVSYLVRNARAEPITLTLRQDELWRVNEVRAESLKGRRTDADSFAWEIPVPANGETTLTFTLRQGW
jgi:hypothetical protein